MTNTKAWIVLAVAAVLLLVTGFIAGKSPAAKSFGAVGSQLIEQYNPYVLYNGGINSALPITTTDALTAAAGTFTGDVTVSGGTLNVTTSNTATSTAIMGCAQTYATSTATAITLRIGSANTAATSTFQGNGNGFVTWAYGTCPNL